MRLPKISRKLQSRLILGICLLAVIIFTGQVPKEILPTSFLNQTEPTPITTNNIVKRVIDGDTIELANGNKVRYIGIDTPERGECYYQEATKANQSLVLGKRVKLVRDVSTVDKYGRLLRYVHTKKRFVNYYLVRNGYATVSTYPPDVANQELFLEAERLARSEKKGFWSDKACTP